MTPEALRWFPSDYLDCGKWGVVDSENRIILGHNLGLTTAQCEAIAVAHNASLGLVR